MAALSINYPSSPCSFYFSLGIFVVVVLALPIHVQKFQDHWVGIFVVAVTLGGRALEEAGREMPPMHQVPL